MSKSKIGMICDILKSGGHVMGDVSPLAIYHDAKAIRDGLRAADFYPRALKVAKKYRVTVEHGFHPYKLTIRTIDGNSISI